MIIALVLFFFIYLMVFAIFIFSHRPQSYSQNIKFSVIVAAKNEQRNISTLINSLSKQNYSSENFEVIIIDDNSTDDTFNLANTLINQLSNFKVIKVSNKIYESKKGALQFGIEKSNYDYILITDADCNPQPDWLTSFSGQFSKGYDFLFGVAPFYQSSSVLNKIASFENLWTHILTFSFANIGMPYSASARSLGFKRESFSKVGGYKNITQTLGGDDDLLLQEAVKAKLKIGIVTNKNSFVYTSSKTSFQDYFKQKARHVSTSNYYTNKIKIILGIWHLLNLFFLFSIFLIPLNFNFYILFLVKIISDIFLVKFSMKHFTYKFKILEVIYLQIFYEFFLIINYVNGTFTKIKWK